MPVNSDGRRAILDFIDWHSGQHGNAQAGCPFSIVQRTGQKKALVVMSLAVELHRQVLFTQNARIFLSDSR